MFLRHVVSYRQTYAMSDKPRLCWVQDRASIGDATGARDEVTLVAGTYRKFIELEPVLDLVERLLLGITIKGKRRPNVDAIREAQVLLREHGRLK